MNWERLGSKAQKYVTAEFVTKKKLTHDLMLAGTVLNHKEKQLKQFVL